MNKSKKICAWFKSALLATFLLARLSGADEPIKLPELVVASSQYGYAAQPTSTQAVLTSDDLASLPQLGDDLFRAVLRLPGLAADDYSARFWVRGAPNRQVMSRLDGVDLINPFHLKDYDGSLSIVDLQTVGDVDLITGGFTAEYGDRLAGVFTMETKRIDPAHLHDAVSLSLTGWEAMNQGAFAEGKGRWMIGRAIRLSRPRAAGHQQSRVHRSHLLRRVSKT